MLWVNACNYQGYMQLISLTFLLYPANNILNNFTRLFLFSCLIWTYAYLLVFLTCRTCKTDEWHEIRPFKINCVAWVRIFCKLYIQGRGVKKSHAEKTQEWSLGSVQCSLKEVRTSCWPGDSAKGTKLKPHNLFWMAFAVVWQKLSQSLIVGFLLVLGFKNVIVGGGGFRSVKAPTAKPASERQTLSQQHMMCKGCGGLVTLVFVLKILSCQVRCTVVL